MSSPPLAGGRMERYTAQRLAGAITGQAGYRVVRTYPEDNGGWVIDVEDRITKLVHTVLNPTHWIDVRGETVRARRMMARTNRMPQPGEAITFDGLYAPVDEAEPSHAEAAIEHHLTKPQPNRREEPETMQTGTAATTRPSMPTTAKGFDFDGWKTITRSAIDQAHQRIEALTSERAGLEDQIRARKAAINAEVSGLLGTVKKLQRAIDVVDRPVRAAPAAASGTSRSLGPKTGATAAKWGPMALAWANEHNGVIDLKALAKQHNVYPSIFERPLTRLVERGELALVKAGHYRVVSP